MMKKNKATMGNSKDPENRSKKTCCCGAHSSNDHKKNKHHHSTAIRLQYREGKKMVDNEFESRPLVGGDPELESPTALRRHISSQEDVIDELKDEIKMLRSMDTLHTYILCKTQGCNGGVRASKSRTGLCIKCLDDIVADTWSD